MDIFSATAKAKRSGGPAKYFRGGISRFREQSSYWGDLVFCVFYLKVIIALGEFCILCFLGVFKYIFMEGFRNLSFLDVSKYHLDGISHFLDVSKYYPGVHVSLQIKHQRGRSNKLNDIAFLVL